MKKTKLNSLQPAKRATGLLDKAEGFQQLFSHVKIQTNESCTRKCPFCYYGQKKTSDKRGNKLPDKIVYKLLDELSNLNFKGRVGLYEINEPLTDLRIFKFIEYASRKIPKAWHMLISNGDLLTIQSLEKLFLAGLDRLYISIYDKQSLKKINQIKVKVPRLFKNVEVMNLINGPFSDNRGGNINYPDAPTPHKPIKATCERVHKILYVRPSGNVVSCYSDFYEVNIMGSVYKNSMEEIWFGDKFKKLRTNLDKGNRSFSPLCSKCNYPGKGGYFKNYEKHGK